jgi:hypothetical protein
LRWQKKEKEMLRGNVNEIRELLQYLQQLIQRFRREKNRDGKSKT